MPNRQEIKVIVSNLHFSGLTFEYRVLEFCHLANERTTDLNLNRKWKPWRDLFDQLWETDMEYCTFWLPESDDFVQEKNSLNIHESVMMKHFLKNRHWSLQLLRLTISK